MQRMHGQDIFCFQESTGFGGADLLSPLDSAWGLGCHTHIHSWNRCLETRCSFDKIVSFATLGLLMSLIPPPSSPPLFCSFFLRGNTEFMEGDFSIYNRDHIYIVLASLHGHINPNEFRFMMNGLNLTNTYIHNHTNWFKTMVHTLYSS